MIINEADGDRDGLIDYTEFYKMMRPWVKSLSCWVLLSIFIYLEEIYRNNNEKLTLFLFLVYFVPKNKLTIYEPRPKE